MGDAMSPSECTKHKKMLEQEQSSFLKWCEALSAQELGCLHILLNAIFLSIDADDIEALALDPDVISIHRVTNFEKNLDRQVPYIGARVVREQYGFNGTGVRVAILDSGIDYTHAELGGEGTREAWEAAYKDFSSCDGLFPTKKIVEGFDFVGEVWPNGPLALVDDPIDVDGHGTHCADITGGRLGVAPGVSLYAVKVCSAISTSCSSIALLQGMEYSVDPNGNGDPSDHVDIVNLSLGSLYGHPFHDDLSQAVEAATAIGVLSVAAAGNSRDRPYVVSSPASILSALAVAQTLIPPEIPISLKVDSINYAAIFQSWSDPLREIVIMGPITYGDGDSGNLDGCEKFAEGALDGKIVLVDHGIFTFTLKVNRIDK